VVVFLPVAYVMLLEASCLVPDVAKSPDLTVMSSVVSSGSMLSQRTPGF
jgi:hypothetical protein